MSTKLIVGLGNFPREFDNTRHNIGFKIVDELLKKYNLNLDENKFNGWFTKTKINNELIIISKPFTYMNLSGDFVRDIVNFYNIDISNILIICDDINLPIGKLRVRSDGSSGGQKGLNDIINKLNSENIKRIRIGIGRPNVNMKISDWVTGKFTSSEKLILKKTIINTIEIINNYLNTSNFKNSTF